MKQVQGKLKSNCFHVGFLQSGGNVHVHVQESLHGTPLFGLFNLQLRQKIDKPFKRSLITIDPEKVDLKLERKRFKFFDWDPASYLKMHHTSYCLKIIDMNWKPCQKNILNLKFIYSEKATKFCEISSNYLSYVVTVKFTMEIL